MISEKTSKNKVYKLNVWTTIYTHVRACECVCVTILWTIDHITWKFCSVLLKVIRSLILFKILRLLTHTFLFAVKGRNTIQKKIIFLQKNNNTLQEKCLSYLKCTISFKSMPFIMIQKLIPNNLLQLFFLSMMFHKSQKNIILLFPWINQG